MIARVITAVLAPIVAKKLAGRQPLPSAQPAERSAIRRVARLVASPILVAVGETAWGLVARRRAQKIQPHPTRRGSSKGASPARSGPSLRRRASKART